MNLEIKVLKAFGPSVAKVVIPEKILNDLNQYIDEILSNEKKLSELDHGSNLAGDVTQEIILEKDFMNKIGWLNFLATCVQEWIKIETKLKLTEFKLMDSWVVRQFKNEYNPLHGHGGHISGAGFLKVPDTLGKFIQNKGKRSYLGGTLDLVHGSRHFMSNSKLTIIPKVGDFYLFPHYLMHTVYPFKGTNEERRSISFNAMIDENIFNVHGRNKN